MAAQKTNLVPPLTPAEKAFIARRRDGLSVPEAAKRMGVAPQTLSAFERGHITEIRNARQLPKLTTPPMLHELCIVERRRRGRTQATLGIELGWCRYWINRIERGEEPAERLAARLGLIA